MPSLNTKLATAPNTTSNYVLRATSSTTIGNSTIQDDGTNVAIGTTPGTYKLNVSGTGNFTGALTGTSGAFTGAFTLATTSGVLAVNTTGRPSGVGGGDNGKIWSKQATTGNYGIATIASATDSFTYIGHNGTDALLGTSYGTTGAYTDLVLQTADTTRFRLSGSTGAATFSAASGGAITLTTNGSANNWTSAITGNSTTSQSYGLLIQAGTNSTDGALRVRNQANSLDWLFVRGDGNVGVGTTSPSVVFNVSDPSHGIGIAYRGSSALPSIAGLFTDTGVSGGTGYGDLLVKARTDYGGFYGINFYTAASDNTPVQRMRIASSGDVCIKTNTASFPASGRGNLTIAGDAGQSALIGFKIGSTDRAYIFVSASDTYIDNTTGTGNVVVLNGSGGVKLERNATSWTSNSDERLKNINGTIENAIDKLDTLRAVNFSWKTDETNKEVLGLIAQDVEKVFPQVVNKSKLSKSIDSNDDDETEYLGVRYTELIPVLVKAIQELNQTVQNQQQQINSLINR